MAKVLVIEDDGDLRFVYERALMEAGYDVTLAENMQAARDALQQMTPDVVFLDMGMPDGSGVEVIDFIHNNPRLKHSQIVVVTANERWEEQTESRNIQHFLVKPVTLHDIVMLANSLTR